MAVRELDVALLELGMQSSHRTVRELDVALLELGMQVSHRTSGAPMSVSK